LLRNYSKIACLDSTHNTCFSKVGRESDNDEKAFLYSIVIKNLETGAGAPAAFMITPSEAQYAIADFLGWLYEQQIFRCKNWMIDCSQTEAAGILKGQGLDCTIFFCLWHVLEAVVEQLKQKLKVCTPITARQCLHPLLSHLHSTRSRTPPRAARAKSLQTAPCVMLP
jgi:hypothetical protein